MSRCQSVFQADRSFARRAVCVGPLGQNRDRRSRPLVDCVAAFDCELVDIKDMHTHRVLFGKVTGLRVGDNVRPLIYYDRSYHVL